MKNICFDEYKRFLLSAINGGISSVQFREKNLSDAEFEITARKLKSLLDRKSIPLVINDRVEIAKKIDAAGVHIGQSDMSPQKARKILGVKKIIGWSVDTEDQLRVANNLDCINYVGVTIFPTKNKLDCEKYWGLDGLRKLAFSSKHPLVAIGGVDLQSIKLLMQNGACGVAVISALHEAENPEEIARLLKLEIENHAS